MPSHRSTSSSTPCATDPRLAAIVALASSHSSDFSTDETPLLLLDLHGLSLGPVALQVLHRDVLCARPLCLRYAALDVSGNRVGDTGAQALQAIVRENPAIGHLGLASCSLSAASLCSVLETVGASSVRSLDLSRLGTRFHGTCNGMDEHVAEALGELCVEHLRALSLSSVGLTFVSALPALHSLSVLDLSANRLGSADDTAAILGNLSSAPLRMLDLSNNALCDDDIPGADALSRLITESKTLVHVNLARNQLGGSFCTLLCNRSVERVQLTHEPIPLETLVLDSNPLGPRGVSQLALLARDSRAAWHSCVCNLVHLSLINTRDHEGRSAPYLSRVDGMHTWALASMPRLAHLSLNKNSLGDSDAVALSKGLRRAPKSLISLNLSHNVLTCVGGLAVFRAALQPGLRLLRLNLAHNELGSTFVREVLATLQDSDDLHAPLHQLDVRRNSRIAVEEEIKIQAAVVHLAEASIDKTVRGLHDSMKSTVHENAQLADLLPQLQLAELEHIKLDAQLALAQHQFDCARANQLEETKRAEHELQLTRASMKRACTILNGNIAEATRTLQVKHASMASECKQITHDLNVQRRLYKRLSSELSYLSDRLREQLRREEESGSGPLLIATLEHQYEQAADTLQLMKRLATQVQERLDSHHEHLVHDYLRGWHRFLTSTSAPPGSVSTGRWRRMSLAERSLHFPLSAMVSFFFEPKQYAADHRDKSLLQDGLLDVKTLSTLAVQAARLRRSTPGRKLPAIGHTRDESLGNLGQLLRSLGLDGAQEDDAEVDPDVVPLVVSLATSSMSLGKEHARPVEVPRRREVDYSADSALQHIELLNQEYREEVAFQKQDHSYGEQASTLHVTARLQPIPRRRTVYSAQASIVHKCLGMSGGGQLHGHKARTLLRYSEVALHYFRGASPDTDELLRTIRVKVLARRSWTYDALLENMVKQWRDVGLDLVLEDVDKLFVEMPLREEASQQSIKEQAVRTRRRQVWNRARRTVRASQRRQMQVREREQFRLPSLKMVQPQQPASMSARSHKVRRQRAAPRGSRTTRVLQQLQKQGGREW